MPRPYTEPYTDDEMDGLRSIFRDMPSYHKSLIKDPENAPYVAVSDVVLFWKRIGAEPNSTQAAMYVDYWYQINNGKIKEEDMINIISKSHDVVLLTKSLAKAFDKNNDGYIQADEFEDLLEKIYIYLPHISKVSFDTFVLQADTNRDGRVSLDELDVWIDNYLNEPKKSNT